MKNYTRLLKIHKVTPVLPQRESEIFSFMENMINELTEKDEKFNINDAVIIDNHGIIVDSDNIIYKEYRDKLYEYIWTDRKFIEALLSYYAFTKMCATLKKLENLMEPFDIL